MPDPLRPEVAHHSVRLLYWYDATFKSRKRTVDLLSPERDNAVLAHSDFEKAVDFLPSRFRLNNLLLYASITAYSCYLFGRRARLPFRRTTLQAMAFGTLTAMGQMWTDYQRVNAHIAFNQSLENPEGYFQAMANIQRRLGGSSLLQPEELIIRHREHHPFPATTSTGTGRDEDNKVTIEDWTYSSDSKKKDPDVLEASLDSPHLTSSPSSNRWDQIRQENARTSVQNSSWDALRQDHERRRLPSNDPTEHSDAGDGQFAEHANLDSSREAERQKA